MSRVCKKAGSVRTDDPLADDVIIQKLEELRCLLSSCYGPHGRLKRIHNNVGGSSVTTSTSEALFKAITFSEPLLRLISAAAMTQATRFGDCGLFTGLFSSSLVDKAVRLGLGAAVSGRVFNYLLEECLRYLTTDSDCKVPVDFGSVHTLMSLAQSMITSKPACMLSPDEVQHITSLTVRAFLQSVPSASSSKTSFGRTVIVTLEGEPVNNSAVFPGLLVELPVLEAIDLKNPNPGPYKIALFGISLSGDLSEDEAFEMHVGLNPELIVLNQLLKLGAQMIADGVGVFACQKVIHPVLQHYLKERGLLVIERLGLVHVELVAKMTGALIINTLCPPVPAMAYGCLHELHPHFKGSKVFLQLLPNGEPSVSTLFLCHRNVTMLDELKITCQRTEHVLRLTLQEPYALIGGGCTETVLSTYIRYKSALQASEAASALKCSSSEFLLGTEVFCSSLQALALSLQHPGQEVLMDMTSAHCWLTDVDPLSRTSNVCTCNCGMVKDRTELDKISLNMSLKMTNIPFLPTPIKESQIGLLDSYRAKLNALIVGVETASLVLNTKYIIRDMN